ncbi:MAG: 1-acyl-sn-glycerol-3-phosphate acyltransferase [Nitriliruptorales bacterium]|nr:1-acyl-sn-glycerol-3-phosphate acyltransferase [Nitriliruptorales bacterium]
MPHQVVRRVVFGPAVILGFVVVLLSAPIWAIVAAALVPTVPGKWRPVRLAWFTFVYLAMEAMGLALAFLLWIASGFGWKLRSPAFVNAHYAVLRLCLGLLLRTARRTFNPTITVDERGSIVDRPDVGRPPLIVLARHAGPGDSFLLVGTLLARGRRPRIVLKEVLQWDPLLDVMLNRLPSRFIPSTGPGRAGSIDAIRELAGSMELDDCMVIFPEGGNFTENRRTRSIAKLEEMGLHDQANLARSMRHVLAPRTQGTLAAIEASPEAEVLFVAHTGLEDLSSPVDLYRGLPMDADVRARVWRVMPEDVPAGEDARETWLYDWFVRIDQWIIDNRSTDRIPDEILRRAASYDLSGD